MRFIALLIVLIGATARAETVGPECSASQEVDRYQLLRRLSLALRGQLPSYEEYVALDLEEVVPEALVDEMLEADQFRVRMRRFHSDLLWPSLAGTQITDVNHVIDAGRGGGAANDRYSVVGAARRRIFRDGKGNGSGQETCGDWLQTELTSDGMPVTRPMSDGEHTWDEDGYVLVRPYWSPETEIKVCAFDAQPAANAKLANGQPVACDTARGSQARGCGCGPELRWCYGPGVAAAVLGALAEQLGRLVDAHTVGGAPYSELLTSRATYTNGLLAFWKQNLAQMSNLNRTFNDRMAVDEPAVTAPDYLDQTWVAAARQAPHSGILTLPGYTLRFQTNRGRANRFRTVFTHQSFVPPATTIDNDCDPTASDLTQRCLCRHCHQVLEPLAAHFGGVAEAGSAVIAGAPQFPVYQPACDPALAGDRPLARGCERFYVVDAAAHAPGTLLAYQYADIDDSLHRQIADNLASGPEGLASEAIELGLVHGAITRYLFAALMGRELILDPGDRDAEIDLLEELTDAFRADDDLRAQVKRIITLPQFRRVR